MVAAVLGGVGLSEATAGGFDAEGVEQPEVIMVATETEIRRSFFTAWFFGFYESDMV